MFTLAGTCEIEEAEGEFNTELRMNEKVRKHCISRPGRVYAIEDDINRLFDSVNIKNPVKGGAFRKNPMKRPARTNSSQASSIGISESVNLKQALRGLCISQASEMAAVKKRLRNLSINEGKKNLLEISFPGKIMANLSEKVPESLEISTPLVTKTKVGRILSQDKIEPLPSESISEKSIEEQGRKRTLNLSESLHSMSNSESCPSEYDIDNKTKNSRGKNPCLIKPVFWNKSSMNRKVKIESNSTSCLSHAAKGIINAEFSRNPMTRNLAINTSKTSPSPNSDGALRLTEKGEFSQSSKSSMGEYSSSTSEESSASGSSRCSNRPHMSKVTRWEAIHSVIKQHGFLSLRHFKLLKRLGSGDIGNVYLAELVGTNSLFALKVMDNEFLGQRKKMVRAQMEKEILQMLDHPFLPTLYAHFTTNKLSCLVMEYCPGGDLHVIRQRQPSRCFSEQAARFYAAEVLLALEYLHMLGIVYRDLKPENILVREDGHIMLSDFDLSLRSVVNPTLLKSSSPIMEHSKKISSSTLCSESNCIHPFCLQPSFEVSCFTPRLLTARKHKTDQAAQVTPLPQLVAEPTNARSNSFVGTHEYLAPEIVKGDVHGSAVDWWTYGIFLYELLYGKTPFKGSSNEETLANVISQPLRFPETPLVSFNSKDLIRSLLIKHPENRLGFVRGAAEIKQHPFFEGLNWALIRCAVPPERPRVHDVGDGLSSSKKDNGKSIEFELF